MSLSIPTAVSIASILTASALSFTAFSLKNEARKTLTIARKTLTRVSYPFKLLMKDSIKECAQDMEISYEEYVNALTNGFTDFKLEFESHKNDLFELCANLERLNQDYLDLQKEYSNENESLKSLKSSKDSLSTLSTYPGPEFNSEIDHRTKRCQSIDERLKGLKEIIDSLQSKIDELRTEISRLKELNFNDIQMSYFHLNLLSKIRIMIEEKNIVKGCDYQGFFYYIEDDISNMYKSELKEILPNTFGYL